MKDLIITTISSNYKWNEIGNWSKSLLRTGYSGDILIIAYNFESTDNDNLKRLQDLGIKNILIPTFDMYGNDVGNKFIWHSGMINIQNSHTSVHNARLFHIWQYLNECQESYRYIISTDGRDTIFQTDPSDWLTKYCVRPMLVSSEGVTYELETWNQNNLITSFGIYLYEYLLKNVDVCNGGTFACNSKELMANFCLTMYLMSLSGQQRDQPAFNIVVRTMLKNDCQFVNLKDSWALQIGARLNQSVDMSDIYYVKNNEIYCKQTNEPYCIVHQYDRISELSDMINKKYE